MIGTVTGTKDSVITVRMLRSLQLAKVQGRHPELHVGDRIVVERTANSSSLVYEGENLH